MRKSKKQTEIAKVETEIIETEKVDTEKVETEKVETEIIVQDDKKDLSKKENALLAVKKNGERLRDLSDKFKEDKEIVKVAVLQNEWALNLASPKLKQDKKFILSLLKETYGWIVSYVDEKLKDDDDVIMKAVERDGCALLYASERLKQDRKIVKKALENDGNCLKYVPHFFNDIEMVKIAIANDILGNVYKKYISDDLRNDDTLKALNENKAWEKIKSPFKLEYDPNNMKKEKPKAYNPYVKLDDTTVSCEP